MSSKSKIIKIALPDSDNPKNEIANSSKKELKEIEKPKKKTKKEYSSEDIRDIALKCIKAMHLMIEPKSISKKFNVVYCPHNAGIEGSLYKPMIVRLKEDFLDYISHSISLLEINSDIYIPGEVRKQIIDRIYYIILTYSEGAPDRNRLFKDLPKWDASKKWCENGYFDEHWKFHKGVLPRGVVKQLGIYIPDNWDTLLVDEGQGFHYITQFFRQLAWTKDDYEHIANEINKFIKTEPTKRSLIGTKQEDGRYLGGFIYNLLTSHSNPKGEKVLAYMFLYCLEINTINEKLLFLQSKGGGGKDSLVEPLVKLLGGIENNAQLSINELTKEFLPQIINRSNLIYNMEAKATDIKRASRKLNQLSGASPFEINSKNRELIPYVNFNQKVLFGLNDPIYTLSSSDGSLNRRVVQYRSYWYTSDDGINPWRSFYVLNDPRFNLIAYDINKSEIRNLPSFDKFPLLLLRYLVDKWDEKEKYEQVFKNYSLKGESNMDTIIEIADETYSKVEGMYQDNLTTLNLNDFISKNMGMRFSDEYVVCANNDNRIKIYNNIPINVEVFKGIDLKKTKFYMPLSTIAKLVKDLFNRRLTSRELQEELIFNNYEFTTKYNGGTKALVVFLDIIDNIVYMTFKKVHK